MKPLDQTWRAAGMAGLLIAVLLAGKPDADEQAYAAQRPQAASQSVAIREAVSPATGHLFVLSQELSGVVPCAVSMLDARTGRIEHVTPVGHYARWLVVGDASHHVFVLNGGLSIPDQVPEAISVLVLDTGSGALLRTIDLGSGEVQQVRLAGRLGQLYVFITPGVKATATAPGAVRVLDTKTGEAAHTLALRNGDNEGLVHQAAHTMFVLNAAGTVCLYDTQTSRLKATVGLEEPEAGPADESHGTVAILTGKQHTTITFVDAATGATVSTLQVTGHSQIVNVLLDEQTEHLFAITFGGFAKAEPMTGTSGFAVTGGEDGVVTTFDRSGSTVLRTQPVGLMAGHAAVDASRHHLFVLSEANVGRRSGPVTITLSLVSVLDTRSGALVRATTLPLTDVLDVADIIADAQAGRAYVNAAAGPAEPNSVTLLDARTGAVVRTVVLPEPAM